MGKYLIFKEDYVALDTNNFDYESTIKIKPTHATLSLIEDTKNSVKKIKEQASKLYQGPQQRLL